MPPCEKPTGTNVAFSWEEIRKHDSEGDAWVVMEGKVFNVSKFLNDHPGGSSIVMGHLGTDIGEVWDDEDYHSHSGSAKKILQKYCIGVVEGEECNSDGDVVQASDALLHSNGARPPLSTETKDGFLKDIDWNKPIVLQVGHLGTNYDKFVHDPLVLDEPARFFEWDFFEFFSRTPWYVVPMVWVPVVCGFLVLSCKVGLTPVEAATGLFGGLCLWTLMEYVLHRFVFHLDDAVQFSYASITAHFLLHGVHHKLPQDPMRLVFPPVLTSFFLALTWYFVRAFFSVPWTHAVTAGGLAGYICYDLCHYYLHHSGIPPLSYFGRLKRYHLAHHYKDHKLGYGITSKWWDIVFGTLLDDGPAPKAKAS
uniref:Fatty acid 2-hydroxylase n=1 Tax=Hemiselmis tepida TaxID=464990 RepID=A0A7S0YUG8_9CRYP|mmetsp:Transcript_18243/g.46076  ORF Transcript_18243/g.46076 Transcript_18243/m.46076 type:complete len:365 (+) Transcript_18243:230-1324(+)|eukprot:CAMPEP_0174931134 /NCGR_PEP_ID=MMETSP1355-20121228/32435_1 /TAXON_ID=464990 /ORGANISM="Hemiselmis tepida, Strain CCMP443" /LENGTH=364 /DNA_ID=CAMNT_0016177469 /DNA_START=221 /DNA_END=1315 /DNA_ORIENTATION=-